MTESDVSPPFGRAGLSSRRIYLLVGIPGCGKSTYARAHLRHCLRVCLDDLRLMLTGVAYDPASEPAVAVAGAAIMDGLLANLDEWQRDLVFDATNVTREWRSRSLLRARRRGIAAIAIYFDCPLEVALARNAGRPNAVPEEIVRRFHAQLEPPTFDEGFADIVVVGP